jgi:hypothetical protein
MAEGNVVRPVGSQASPLSGRNGGGGPLVAGAGDIDLTSDFTGAMITFRSVIYGLLDSIGTLTALVRHERADGAWRIT